MPLSNSRPFSPITCPREITDSTSAVASAQRGQFFATLGGEPDEIDQQPGSGRPPYGPRH